MLQLIRDNAQGVIIWIIVGFVILGLSSFILSSYLGSGVKNYVAKVNDVEISNRQYQIAFNNRQAQLQQQLGENFSRFFNESLLRTSVVNGLVESELLTQLTHEAGLRNTAEQAKKSLEKVPVFLGEDGKFSNRKFSDVVAQYGYTPEGYALEQAVSLSNQQFIKGISDSALVLKSSVNDFQRLTRQQRDMGYLTVNKAVVSQDIEVSEDDVKAWFDQHAKDYMTQEKISVEYLELSLKDLSNKQEVDDDEVRDFYEKNKSRYTISDEREASHILIKLDDKTTAETAQAKLNEIKSKLTAGASFADLAKQYSHDKFSAKNGGRLDRVSRGQNDPAFDNELFTLKEGEISDPVRTQFGFHLIKLDKIFPGKAKAFEEVKQRLTQELKNQKAERIFYEGQTKLENLTYQHQDSLEPAAEALGFEIKTSPIFTRAGGAQQFRNPDLLREAFSEEVLFESLNSNMIKLSEDHLIVLRLKQHIPSKQKSFDEVKSLAENQLKQDRAQQKVTEIAAQQIQQLNEGKAPESIVNAHKAITWNNPGYIGREAKFDVKQSEQKTPSNTIAADVRKALFSLKKPTSEKAIFHNMSTTNGDSIIIVFRSVRENPIQEEQSVLDAMQKQLMQTSGQTDTTSVIEYMRSQSDVDINTQKEDEF